MFSETDLNLMLAFALIVASAMISCFETSITAASRAKIHRLANEKDARAKKLEKLLKVREKVVSVMLISNNVINIAASVLTTKVMLELFGEVGLLYSTGLLTILIIVFGEILPKTYAMKAPEKIALTFCGTITFLFRIFSPVVFVIQKIVNLFINFFGRKEDEESRQSQLEEIRDTVDLKAKEGGIFKYDKDLLDGVLDLSDTELSEIMVHRQDVVSLNADLPLSEILEAATAVNYTRIPLWRDNKENIVAVLNVRKLLKALHFYQGDLKDFDLSSVTSEPWFVPSTNSLRSQLFSFRKKKKRFALVIDEYGSFLGLVTLEDILEEIVGEIKEQDEISQINIVKTRSGSYRIAGRTLVRDINRKLDLNLEEHDDAHNLSAFIIHELGRIPSERESFNIGNFSFKILRRRNHELLVIALKPLK
jgi:Mg2+/Co2+ transporter CorB